MAGVISLGHVGIAVRDLPRMLDFYTRVLGLTVTDGGARGAFLSARPHLEHHEFVIGLNPDRRTNAPLISFRVQSLDDLRELYHAIKDDGHCSDVTGINHGISLACGFRDPEGNRVELFCPTGVDYPQPHADPVDLDLPDADLQAAVGVLPPKSSPIGHRYGADAGKRQTNTTTRVR
jgi:catechol 2,3-dioxygenase-like lactoylglutathione lyase family enzyme